MHLLEIALGVALVGFNGVNGDAGGLCPVAKSVGFELAWEGLVLRPPRTTWRRLSFTRSRLENNLSASSSLHCCTAMSSTSWLHKAQIGADEGGLGNDAEDDDAEHNRDDFFPFIECHRLLRPVVDKVDDESAFGGFGLSIGGVGVPFDAFCAGELFAGLHFGDEVEDLSLAGGLAGKLPLRAGGGWRMEGEVGSPDGAFIGEEGGEFLEAGGDGRGVCGMRSRVRIEGDQNPREPARSRHSGSRTFDACSPVFFWRSCRSTTPVTIRRIAAPLDADGGPGDGTEIAFRRGRCQPRMQEIGTEQEQAIDISQAAGRRPATSRSTRATSTPASTTSAITFLDGEKGILRYRGYPIEELAEQCDFVETSYLLIYGELPNAEQLDEFPHVAAAPHDAARGHAVVLQRLSARRPSDGDPQLGGRRALDVLPGFARPARSASRSRFRSIG